MASQPQDTSPSTATPEALNHQLTSAEISDITDRFDTILGEEGHQDAPPAYSDRFELNISRPGFNTHANVTGDGRVSLSINEKTSRLSQLFAPALRQRHDELQDEPPLPAYTPSPLGSVPEHDSPRLNIVVQVVGSRGDVQPFVALGKELKTTYGHRIRLATHATFKTFVEENGLEFFNIGGDPAELMAYMVKNPGLMPGMDAIRSGDVSRRRRGMEEIVRGCWRSCIEPSDGMDDPLLAGRKASTAPDLHSDELPFVADAIIANPPSFAHIHIAEKLGIPLHMMFTMPWSPTQAFPHPLADIKSSNADVNVANYLSYVLMDMLTWQGLGDILNRFREKVLGLEPVSLLRAPGALQRLRVPFTYCWSPALIPKPKDWGQNISVSGFYFLSLASSYRPDVDLAGFLSSGPPPVYIGFGSIVVDDPDAMTRIIFEAIRKAGVRALVSKGWGGLGGDTDVPEGVFMLGNVPHDWLFEHVSCVVHHGGAGTTSTGLFIGKPTVVVPFFGDQPFWGAMVAQAGAGPEPIPHAQLTADRLATAISAALRPETLQRAQEIGRQIRKENGTDLGAKSFNNQVGIDDLRCTLAPGRVAVWRLRRTQTRLSTFAATVLINDGLIKFSDLKPYRSREYIIDSGPSDPLLAGTGAILGSFADVSMGVADASVELARVFRPKRTISHAPSSSSQGDSADRKGDTPSARSSGSSERTLTTPAARVTSNSSTATNSGTSDTGKRVESAVAATKSIGRIVRGGIRSPMDFSVSMARGFHNAPKWYGDDTIRPTPKVDDLQSGLKAAGKTFGYGLYDGISGLVTQPLRGAEKDGAVGLLKGFGKGVGGLILKPGAAIWGLPGYALLGLHKEAQKTFGVQSADYITSLRITEGYTLWKAASAEERAAVVISWKQRKLELQGVRQQVRDEGPDGQDAGRLSAKGFLQTRHLSLDERKKLSEDRRRKREDKKRQDYQEAQDSDGVTEPSDKDLEQAITASIAATSTGNAIEDRAIERAIRASVSEVQNTDCNDEEALNRAIQASIAAAGSDAHPHDDVNEAEYKAALQQSLKESFAVKPRTRMQEEEEFEADLNLAIALSKQEEYRA